MQASLRTLLAGIIDYAGLFPPAKLAMPDALRTCRDFRAGEHSWMLGRLIVSVRDLESFDANSAGLLPGNHADEPWRLSVIASPACDLTSLDGDLERIEAFNERHDDASRGLCAIDAVELRAESSGEIDAALDLIPGEFAVFIEMPIHGDPRGMIAALAGTNGAAKVRTGGPSVEHFPTPVELAQFIWSCAMADTPFKATAGLHHPFRHDSVTVPGAKEFGFLNVFIGAALARHERIDEKNLELLLADESRDSFAFEDGRIAWRGLSVDDIASARAEFALSYGSCSVEEPIEDLKAAGLLL